MINADELYYSTFTLIINHCINYSLELFSLLASAVLLARPSLIASVKYESTFSIDFEASSLAGIGKSTSRGSEFVSTIAKIGMFNF